MSGEYRRLSVIIPMFNEEDTIAQVLDAVGRVDLEAIEKEVVVVDDGSTDRSPEIVAEYAGRPDSAVKLVAAGGHRGKGAAIRAGLEHVTGEIVLIQDADLEYDPEDYPALLAPILAGQALVVYGSRFHRPVANMAWPNRIINWMLARLANLLYGTRLTDEATCYKVFDTQVLKSLRVRCVRFEFCPEVTARLARAGYRIHEVPISYQPRTAAQGKKIRWTDGVSAIWTLVKYRFVRLTTDDRPEAQR